MRDEGRLRLAALQSYGLVLRVPGYRFLAVAQVLAEGGVWLSTIALFLLVYRTAGALPAVAWLAGAHLLPRLAVALAVPLVARLVGYQTGLLAYLLRGVLVAALAWWSAALEIGILIAAAAALGLLGAIAERSWLALVPSLVPRAHLATASALTGRLQHAGILLGALFAALAIAFGGERAALAVAAACLTLAWFAGLGARPRATGTARCQPAGVSGAGLGRPPLRLLLVGVFVGALIGLAFRVTLVDLAGQTADDSGVMYAFLLALFGAGALAGPLPVPRLLGRFGPRLNLAGLFGVQAGVYSAVALVPAVPVLGLAMFLSGIIVTSGDLLAATIARRLTPARNLDGSYRYLVLIALVGQIAGALLVAVLGVAGGATAILWALAGLGALTALGAGLSQARAHV